MFDVVRAVTATLRPAIEGLSLAGTTPRLYVGVVPDSALVPYAYIRRGSESLHADSTAGTYEAIVYLDLYARSSDEVARMENAAAFLDSYNPPPFGNAMRIQYEAQSKTQLSEAVNREHTTVLYAVRYADKRKLVGR